MKEYVVISGSEPIFLVYDPEEFHFPAALQDDGRFWAAIDPVSCKDHTRTTLPSP